ncbi:MAG: L,D-transpeptidase family protein [bacterium]
MRHPLICGITLWVVTWFVCALPSNAQTIMGEVRTNIMLRVEMLETGVPLSVEGDRIRSLTALPRFYYLRAFQPAWSDRFGPVRFVHSLIKAIHDATQEGLQPRDYHLTAIEGIFGRMLNDQKGKQWTDPALLADFDILLTDAFLTYASHLLFGRVDPETFERQWEHPRAEEDLARVLRDALVSGRIEAALQDLTPRDAGYTRLREALGQYRDIAAAGGWPMVPFVPKTRNREDRGAVVPLVNRLVISGDLRQNIYDSEVPFDAILAQAIRAFQARHGLTPDGVLGPVTLKALNVSADERVRQIELNMERWRWLPRDLGDPCIIVNIADFRARVFEGDRAVLEMRVVVGKDYRQTPVFSGTMERLVFSPYWYIPQKIAVEDKLPLILRDPNYLVREHIDAFQWGNNGWLKEVDPNTIDWHMADPNTFPYKLRQEPGPWNPLGRIKFIFPNKYAVYLHDTPSQELFEKAPRTFSSGCIRIEKPIELAEFLLQADPRWTRERILSAASSDTEQTVRLPCPVQVHIQYWTAWANEDLGMEFRKDIYGSDRLLDQALSRQPPAPE